MDENNTAQKSSFPIIPVVIVAVIVLGGLFFVMSRNSANKASKETTQQTQQPQQVENAQTQSASPKPSDAMKASDSATPETMTSGTVKEFTVKGQNFSFTPNEIRVKKGDKVKITFQNTGGFHDFVLDEFNVKTNRISDGQSATVEFTADKAGTFEYYCSVGNHRQMGMKGNLIVE